MKRLFITISILFMVSGVYADWGFYNSDRSWIILNEKGSNSSFSVWNESAGSIQNADLGTYLTADVLQLVGYDIKTYKNNGGDVTGGKFYYVIYPKGNRPGSPTFSPITFSWLNNIGEGGDQKWGFSAGTYNLLNGLSSGEYTIEFYAEMYGTTPDQTLYDNNNGNATNYTAHFRYNYVRSSADGNWSNSSTWLNDIVPGSGETAEINTAVNVDGDITIAALTINSGKSLTINSDKSLTVSGTLTNSAGNAGLVIKSDASGTGSLIHSTAGVAGTVERYIAAANWGTWDDGWHSLSSPVDAQALSAFETTGDGNDYDIYGWDELTNTWKNYKDGGFESWNGSSNFNVGQGYLVAYQQEQTGKSFSGNLNVDDVSIPTLALSSGTNKGWHLLGNPFASALTWDNNWATTNIGGVANIWNGAGKSYTPINSGEPIPATNGFMVQVTTASGSLTIPAAKRVHSAQGWYKNSDYPVIQLFARDLTDQSFQESQIRVNPESTFAFEAALDGNFLPGYAPLFYSVSDGHDLMVNSLPEITAETTIPFHFIKSEGTSFSITASDLDGITATPYLIDLKTGSSQNLMENPVYTFTSTEGDDPARFELKFGAVGISDPATAPSINAWFNAGTLYVADETGVTNINVFNVQGQQVQQARVQGNGVQTVRLQLPAGVYIAQLVNNGSSQTIKLIVQ